MFLVYILPIVLMLIRKKPHWLTRMEALHAGTHVHYETWRKRNKKIAWLCLGLYISTIIILLITLWASNR